MSPLPTDVAFAIFLTTSLNRPGLSSIPSFAGNLPALDLA